MGLRDLLATISPTWLATGNAEKLLYSMGLTVDALIEKADQAVKAWLPMRGTPTALPYLGDDRQIPRGLFETDDAYALRLKRAFAAWRHAGAPWGVLGQVLGYLSPYGLVLKYVKNYADPITTDTASIWDLYAAGVDPAASAPTQYTKDPMNWNWDGYYEKWWRRWLILYPPSTVMVNGPKWGDGHKWGDGSTWGTSWIAQQGASLRAIVGRWKSGGTFVQWIIFSLDPTLFDETAAAGDPSLPDGAWGNWGRTITDANGYLCRVPSRNANARYASGVI